ncbi:MAG: DUF6531 domain-containing protein, partial [Nitrospirota bacterium]
MLAKLKSGIILSFIFFLLSLFSTAWGASGNVTITSPDPNQVYETATSFSVGGTYRMDSNDSGSIWVPAGDPSLPQCSYGGWLFPGGYYNGDWGEGTIGVVYYTVDDVYKSQIGYVWWNIWGYNNIGVDNRFGAWVNISGLDPKTDHTVVINLQKAYGAQCYDPFCHGYGCGGSWTLFQVNRYIIASKTLNFRITGPCDLKITKFSGDNTTIDPDAGGSVNLSGSISDTSGKPISWTIDIAGMATFSGTGTGPAATWDGKKADGKVIDPGTYTATLIAWHTDDPNCKDTKTTTITVQRTKDCKLQITFGSSANAASGNLSHSQELFSAKGAGLATSMTLYYNSLDPYSGPLGTGWTHSYDIAVKENSDGSVVLREGDGGRKLYTKTGSGYLSQPGDYSALAKNADNTFVITQADGSKYTFGADGKITSIVDRNGNTMTFAYT